ncbi:hypothetical protein [Ruminococcus sp.]|uniref:hypothetical protein n=1 Tax=Ruminococcus sp. TaxID=41978 RepID=UPI00300E7D53
MIDEETRQQFEDEVYLICGEDKKTASRIMTAFDTLRGKPGVLVTEEQLKQIKKQFWQESGDVLGDAMIEINEAYGIVRECIGCEEE